MGPSLDPTQNPTLDLTHVGPQASALPNLSIPDVLPVAFTVAFVVWAVWSLMILYHWVRYGRDSWLAVPVVVAHLVVSALLILFMASGLR